MASKTTPAKISREKTRADRRTLLPKPIKTIGAARIVVCQEVAITRAGEKEALYSVLSK